MKHSKFAVIVLILVMVFLYLPIFVLVGNSFNASKFGSDWAGFTLKWYEMLFSSQNRAIWQAFERSLGIAALATAASCVLGTTISSFVTSVTYIGLTRFSLPLMAMCFMALVPTARW